MPQPPPHILYALLKVSERAILECDLIDGSDGSPQQREELMSLTFWISDLIDEWSPHEEQTVLKTLQSLDTRWSKVSDGKGYTQFFQEYLQQKKEDRQTRCSEREQHDDD